jgi:hypothetical protein
MDLMGFRRKPVPAWVRCGFCEDFLCTFHRKHVFECPCPAIEDWDMSGLNPYFDPYPKDGVGEYRENGV